jgi:hypothetical protein
MIEAEKTIPAYRNQGAKIIESPGCLPEATDFQKRETSHFVTVGFLIPSHSGKSFKVFAEVEGKQVFIGLASKESLLNSLSLKQMVTVKISRFVCNPGPGPSRQRVNCIREVDPEKLRFGGI